MNKTLKEWYLAGYNDEKKGTSTIMDGNPLNESAYDLGAQDASSSLEVRSVSQIIRELSVKPK